MMFCSLLPEAQASRQLQGAFTTMRLELRVFSVDSARVIISSCSLGFTSRVGNKLVEASKSRESRGKSGEARKKQTSWLHEVRLLCTG